jgi:hypothetical protein
MLSVLLTNIARADVAPLIRLELDEDPYSADALFNPNGPWNRTSNAFKRATSTANRYSYLRTDLQAVRVAIVQLPPGKAPSFVPISAATAKVTADCRGL